MYLLDWDIFVLGTTKWIAWNIAMWLTVCLKYRRTWNERKDHEITKMINAHERKRRSWFNYLFQFFDDVFYGD